jgi:hypothetical protein
VKSALATAAALALFALVGCDTGSPGRPVLTTRRESRPGGGAIAQGEGTFTLSSPHAIRLKQGESTTIAIGINRGWLFLEHVTLKFENLPKGVSVEPAAPAVEPAPAREPGVPPGDPPPPLPPDTPKPSTLEALEKVERAFNKEEKVAIKAAADADLGDFTVKVIGHPEKGADVTNDLKLTVEKK